MKFKKSCNIEVTNFSYVKALLRRKRGNGGGNNDLCKTNT